MTTNLEAEAASFAADPDAWGEPQGRVTGTDAAAHGRALLEAAGIDVAAVERSVGRPRLGRLPTTCAACSAPLTPWVFHRPASVTARRNRGAP